jgi:hypothetical protein
MTDTINQENEHLAQADKYLTWAGESRPGREPNAVMALAHTAIATELRVRRVEAAAIAAATVEIIDPFEARLLNTAT